MPSFLAKLSGASGWAAIAGIGFAIIFFVVGALRVVEFSGLRLGPLQRRLLITGHLLGCFLFSAAFATLGIDSRQEFKQLIGGLLFSSMLMLFPIHIYIGIKRRIALRDAQSAAEKGVL